MLYKNFLQFAIIFAFFGMSVSDIEASPNEFRSFIQSQRVDTFDVATCYTDEADQALGVCSDISTIETNPNEFENLTLNQSVADFSVANLYTDGEDRAMGARFICQNTGFIIDLLRVQTVPQAYIWVKTPPKWDKGEPHTCEHLVLGKGSVGKDAKTLEGMSLGNSSAYTDQVKTAYHFNTTAGEDIFYDLFHTKLNALLNPNFTDEDIRREVCHAGVVVNPEDGGMSIEEKGTVYTEMVSNFEKHWNHLFSPLEKMQYGDNHPLINDSGGDPAAIREMVPEDLWSFHEEFYQLNNMGMIVTLADDFPMETCLEKFSGILDDLRDSGEEKGKYTSLEAQRSLGVNRFKFADPKWSEPEGQVKISGYPSMKLEDPGYALFGWRPELEVTREELTLLFLFTDALSKGSSSHLYNRFINSDTKKYDFGITELECWVSNCMGYPIYFSFDFSNHEGVTEDKLLDLYSAWKSEILAIHDFKDGSEELLLFNKEARSRLEQYMNEDRKLLNSPPMFGFRMGPGWQWFETIKNLEEKDDFRKSFVKSETLELAEELLDSGENFWREYINNWKLLKVTPYIVGVKPDPEMLKQAKLEKKERIAAYIEGFKQKYGVDDEAEAIALYKEEFDRNTLVLEEQDKQLKVHKFIDNPPMTFDDQLNYETINLQGDIPLVASSFDNMNSMTFGAAMRLDVIPEEDLVYLPFLPRVINRIGVSRDGEIIEFDELQNRIRSETLGLNVYIDVNLISGRYELVVKGTARSRNEFHGITKWMDAGLRSPLLTEDNLPCLLDIIDRDLSSLRNTMNGMEERWMRDPSLAFRWQAKPLFLSSKCFLTKVHHMQRLRWLLTDPGEDRASDNLVGFIDYLTEMGTDKNRDELKVLLEGKLDFNILEANIQVSEKIISELKITIEDIPDENLSGDWTYLCEEIKVDISVEPLQALGDISRILNLIQCADNSRLFLISSSHDREDVMPDIVEFCSGFETGTSSTRIDYPDNRRITEQLKSRVQGDFTPTYIGLLNENSRNGVMLFSNSHQKPFDTDRDAILDQMSANLYGGYAAHGVFRQTSQAGLAYSNGIGLVSRAGHVCYLAERCPDIAETMRFVVEVVNRKIDSPEILEHITSLCFMGSRAPGKYEHRGEKMAADLADGYTPERIREYRQRILEVRNTEGLLQNLKERLPEVYGKVLIGYGKNLSEHEGGNYFIIGPEEQFESMENYIGSVEYPQPVYRLYPRDFWIRLKTPVVSSSL